MSSSDSENVHASSSEEEDETPSVNRKGAPEPVDIAVQNFVPENGEDQGLQQQQLQQQQLQQQQLQQQQLQQQQLQQQQLQ
ncbi:hypothetical protein EPH_0040630 [Eimeria praecox]|uniref:Uncharacterized protein n=1 Tax=Eimeria praecox TaxID=51316 RepID=U6G5C1_9EIME|nr:hypothetical protein EPH_0040630 [Eimeria praecox]